MGQSKELPAVLRQCAVLQKLAPHGFIDLLTAPIVRGDDDGVVWLGRIVSRDGGDALWRIAKLDTDAKLKSFLALLTEIRRKL
jgi:hypothetical protein